MIDASTAPYAALLLRIGLGLLFLAHGNLQIRVYGLPTEAKYFRSIGLPGHLVYLTAAMQLAGGIARVTGVYARFAALLLLPIIVGTIVTVHASKGWLFTNKDGGWEYPAFLGSRAAGAISLGRWGVGVAGIAQPPRAWSAVRGRRCWAPRVSDV